MRKFIVSMEFLDAVRHIESHYVDHKPSCHMDECEVCTCGLKAAQEKVENLSCEEEHYQEASE